MLVLLFGFGRNSQQDVVSPSPFPPLSDAITLEGQNDLLEIPTLSRPFDCAQGILPRARQGWGNRVRQILEK